MIKRVSHIGIAFYILSLSSSSQIDIRKVAQRVNKKLKDLIISSDDEDSSTDVYDQIQVNLISGSPRKPSRLPIDSKPTEEPTTRDIAVPLDEETVEQQVVDPNKFSLLTVLGVLIPHMRFTEQETRLETLRWLLWLHQKLPKRVSCVIAWAKKFAGVKFLCRL